MAEHIERMKAISEIKSYEFSHCPEYMQDWATKLKRAILDDIVDGIMDIPVADVAPVRHGQAFYLDDCANAGWYCDQCHKKHPKKPKFCSNCGAKLDLEAQHE